MIGLEAYERARRIRGLILDVDGVLTDNRVYFGREGELMRAFNVRDGLGLAFLRKAGYRLGIVSGRASDTVAARAEELGIDPVLLDRADKRSALDEVLAIWKMTAEEVAAMGDDLLDGPMLSAVGLSMAPADARDELLARVDFVTGSPGGHGAVREACELLLKAGGHWEEILRRHCFAEDSAWKNQPEITG